MKHEKEPSKLRLNHYFIKKSTEIFDLDLGQIQTLIKHRDRMDWEMINTPADKQLLRSMLLLESKQITRKINQIYKPK